MPFEYFPTEEEFHEVLGYVTAEIDPLDQPDLIDLTGSPPSPPYAPHTIECDHGRIKCGYFYGGICKGVPAVNTNHHHVYQTCGFCEQSKTNCLPTQTSDEWVCSDCCVEQTELNFCDICSRFDETDDMHHCGKCQFICNKDSEDITNEEELSQDDSPDALIAKTQEGYAKDGFVVSDSESELEDTPEEPKRKRRIQGKTSRSFHDTQWDLIHEEL